MGIDFLDLKFRIEKEFGVSSRTFNVDKLEVPRDEHGYFKEVTCRQVLAWIELTLREDGKPVPEDCWPRLRACIAKTVALKVENVSLDSRLMKVFGYT